MYKDKDKQREANRLRMQRVRAKGNTKQDNGVGNTDYPRVTDQDFTRLMATAGLGHVRVSKPGDADYEPQCETTKAFVEQRTGIDSMIKPKPDLRVKRGKDIKVFEEVDNGQV